MAKVNNNFIGGKMNKDLTGRLLPRNQYRNALNAQVSKSEGPNTGDFQNVLGNSLMPQGDFAAITGIAGLKSIGYFADEASNYVYIFLTDNPTGNYIPTRNHYIYAYNTLTQISTLLVEGSFLNFNISYPITGVNILESLLFWTDNRNQPRKINVDTALNNPGYYTTEDHISVAKYNPFINIELYKPSSNTDDKYETTMYNVSSKFYPEGGSANITGTLDPAATSIQLTISTIEGDVAIGSNIAYIAPVTGLLIETGATVSAYNSASGQLTSSVAIGPFVSQNVELVFNYNPYYEGDFNGDPDFLEDKFVRFAYRLRFDDGEFSIMSPFTQNTFIPKQDGYFLYKDQVAPPVDIKDEEDAFRSTIVEFMENKVDKILLRIPFEYQTHLLEQSLKIKSIDILYKQSNQVTVSVLETIPIQQVADQTAEASVLGNFTAQTSISLDNILYGSITPGVIVSGNGIENNPSVVSFDAVNNIVVLSNAQTLANDTVLLFGDLKVFEYEYQSKKPYKILPTAATVRVYDKVPVKALAQEIISNRVVYGNFQDKHTPPASLNYNVAVGEKGEFNLNQNTSTVVGGPYNGTLITIIKAALDELPSEGDFISLLSGTGSIPLNTQVVSVTENPPGSNNYDIVLTNAVSGVIATDIVFFEPGADTLNSTSVIEYPNHTLKQNRNYQVGVVLSDRYGRSSTVVLSNNKQARLFESSYFTGSTVYAPYLTPSTDTRQWPGNSLKILFNETISPTAPQQIAGWPGVYNGDVSSVDYNPLGWYSFKVVVKQQEQEYYNVYLPGVMAAYPSNTTLELGKTSHTVLINDNINKIPRDLTEVGPTQRQFRSSVKLFGRVENNSGTDAGSWNNQFYPGRSFDFASSISTNNLLFDGDNQPSYISSSEFYSIESDPFIARLSTITKFGITATIIQATSLVVSENATIGFDILEPLIGVPFVGCAVSGFELPSGLIVKAVTGTAPNITGVTVSKDGAAQKVTLAAGTVITFTPPNASESVQKLAIYETEPVESLLEIFWETSTSGTVGDLNNAILDDSNSTDSIFGFNSINFCESSPIGTNISTGDFTLIDNFGTPVPYVANQDPPQLQLVSVTDFTNPPDNDRSSDFALVDNGNGTYNIQTLSTFYYGFDADTAGTFSFELLSTVNGVEATIVVEPVTVCNVEPVINNCPATPISWDPSASLDLNAFTGVNGSISTTEQGLDLVWSLAVEKDGVQYGPPPIGNGTFTLSFSDGVNQSLCTVSIVDGVEFPPGNYNFTLTLTDAGGDSVDCNFIVAVIPTDCCAYVWEKPLVEITIGAGTVGQITRFLDVPIRFTNCDGEVVTTTEPLNGQFFIRCLQSPPETAPTTDPTNFTVVAAAVQYCVPNSVVTVTDENGELVPYINPNTGEQILTPDCIG